MNIGIFGSGRMGAGFGELWAERGHRICFSHSRDQVGLQRLVAETGENAALCSSIEAAQFGEVILLTLPWTIVPELLADVRPYLGGKTVLTCVLPWGPNQNSLALGTTTSEAERIAEMVPEAHIVEVLPLLAEALYAPSRRFGAEASTVFYCGDHGSANATVAALLAEVGFEPIDAGRLESARYLEPTAALLWHLAMHQGAGPEIALKLLRR